MTEFCFIHGVRILRSLVSDLNLSNIVRLQFRLEFLKWRRLVFNKNLKRPFNGGAWYMEKSNNPIIFHNNP
jgi:hypothetical protein